MNSMFPSHRAPRTIALIGKYHSPEVADSLFLLAEYLHQRGVVVFIERETATSIGTGRDLTLEPPASPSRRTDTPSGLSGRGQRGH